MTKKHTSVSKINKPSADGAVQRGTSETGIEKKSYSNLGYKALLKECDHIFDLIPATSEFLGKKIQYKKPGNLKSRRSKRVKINQYRVEVNSVADRDGVCNCREEITRNLKKFPHFAELHILHSILNYSDTLQGGQVEERVDQMRPIVKEMVIALHNGADSVFNASWFLKIYATYLVSLHNRSIHLHPRVLKMGSEKGKEINDKLRENELMLQSLLEFRNYLDQYNKLRKMTQGTVFLTQEVTDYEVKEACKLMITGRNDQKVGTKSAKSILYVAGMTMFIYSGIPVMKERVEQYLKILPDNHRDLVLQKKMINTSLTVMSFKLEKAQNHKKNAADLAEKIYSDSSQTISEHLESAVIRREYEVDPFLKLAWIVIEMHDYKKNDPNYKTLIQNAKDAIEVVIGPRNRVYTVTNRAKKLNSDLVQLLYQYE